MQIQGVLPHFPPVNILLNTNQFVHVCHFRVTIEHARVRLRGGRGRGASGGGGRFSDRYGRGSQSSRRYV